MNESNIEDKTEWALSDLENIVNRMQGMGPDNEIYAYKRDSSGWNIY